MILTSSHLDSTKMLACVIGNIENTIALTLTADIFIIVWDGIYIVKNLSITQQMFNMNFVLWKYCAK